MGVEKLENPNPVFIQPAADRLLTDLELVDDVRDEIDAREIFDILFA